MWQQILDIEDTAHVVYRVLIDRDARIIILHDAFDDIRELALEVEVNDILPAGHHLLGRLVTKAHNTFQHVLLVLEFCLVGQFQCLFQVVHAQHMAFFLNDLPGPDSGADKDACHRVKEPAQHEDAPTEAAAHRQGMLPTIHLGYNLAEKQQKKSQQHRNNKEL